MATIILFMMRTIITMEQCLRLSDQSVNMFGSRGSNVWTSLGFCRSGSTVMVFLIVGATVFDTAMFVDHLAVAVTKILLVVVLFAVGS